MPTITTISLVERMIYLKRTPILSGVETRDLQQIAMVCSEAQYEPGDVIGREGERGDRIYIITSGEVRILSADRGEIAVRSEGDALGEMSIIRDQPRSASMVAATPVVALTLDRRSFESILRSRPDVSIAVMRMLCDRLLESESSTGNGAG